MIGAYFDIDSCLEGEAKRVRSGGFVPKMGREDQTQEVVSNLMESLKTLLF